MYLPAFCRDFGCNGGRVWFARPITAALIIFVLRWFSAECVVTAQTHSSIPVTQPESAVRIDLSKVGYQEMASMERLSEDESNVSLDYVDEGHVLLTFAR